MHRFRVEVIAKTPNPQQVIYAAMHQDYTDGFVFSATAKYLQALNQILSG
jgi:hypothetical protein